MGFKAPKIRAPAVNEIIENIPEPPQDTPDRIRRKSGTVNAQLAAQSAGTSQLGGFAGTASSLNIPAFFGS